MREAMAWARRPYCKSEFLSTCLSTRRHNDFFSTADPIAASARARPTSGSRPSWHESGGPSVRHGKCIDVFETIAGCPRLADMISVLAVLSVLLKMTAGQSQCLGAYTDASNPYIKHNVWHPDAYSVSTGADLSQPAHLPSS